MRQTRDRLGLRTLAVILALLLAALVASRWSGDGGVPSPGPSADSGPVAQPATPPVPARGTVPSSTPAGSGAAVPGPGLHVQLAGRVLALRTGRPVAGARLSLRGETGSGAGDPTAFSAVDGTYRLEFWLDGAGVAVIAEHEAHLPVRAVLLNRSIGGDGVVEGFDLRLPERSAGAALRGELRDTAGGVLRAVPVELRRQDPAGAEADLPAPPLAGVTDDRGRFGFRAIPPGNYALTARAARCADFTLAPLDLGTGTVTDLGTLVLEPLDWGAIHGVVRDAGGAPLPGVEVSAAARGRPGHRRRTDGRGAYRFERVDAADWHVTVEDGRGLELRQTVSLGPAEDRRLDFHLPRGAHVVGGRALLGDRPAAGWTVHAIPASPPPEGVSLSWTGRLDEQGQFLLEGLRRRWSSPSRPGRRTPGSRPDRRRSIGPIRCSCCRRSCRRSSCGAW